MTYVLSGETGYLGCKVVRKGQLDQLRRRLRDGGRIVGRRHFRLQICIGQLLEGGVGHPLEEAAQGGVIFQLGGDKEMTAVSRYNIL